MSLTDLVSEVSSLLGFSGSVGETDMPSLSQVKAWLFQGERYLASALPVDAVPELWKTIQSEVGDTETLALPDGARVVSVSGLSSESNARLFKQTSSLDWFHKKNGSSLFGADTTNPIWRLVTRPILAEESDSGDPADTIHGLYIEVYDGSDITPQVEVVYVDTTASTEIRLGPPLHPLLVKYAIYMAHMADEDDQAAALAFQSLETSVQSVTASNLNRYGAQAPMALDGTGTGTDRATNRRG